MSSKTKHRPWERLRTESAPAYEAFLAYRDMGVKRSLDAVSQNGNESGVKSRSTISHWSSKNQWVERCRHWDNHVQEARDQVIRQEAAKWERRRQAELELVYEDQQALREKGRRLLDMPLTTKEIKQRDKDGVQVTIVKYVKGQLTEAANALWKAAEMGAALGAATAKDPADMTDAELLGIEEAIGDLDGLDTSAA